MASDKFYTIIVGRKEPAMVLQGQLSKQTGMPTGDVQKVRVTVGAFQVPNWSRAWGRRIQESNIGKKNDGLRSISVTDPKYNGDIEFLPAGHKEGESIEIRYLPNSNTLDKLYQETVQKIVPRPQGEDAMITLQQGLNNFDEGSQRLLVMMLKNHTLNLNSPCRPEDATDYDFVNFNPETRNNTRLQALNIRAEADTIVARANADQDGALIVLAEIFKQEAKQQPSILLEYMIEKAMDYPQDFVNAVNQFRKSAETSLVEALDQGILELRDNGRLILKAEGNNPPVVLLTDVEGEGDDRKLWLVQQCTSNLKVYEAMDKIIKALDRHYKVMV